jgi:hypothetical protein
MPAKAGTHLQVYPLGKAHEMGPRFRGGDISLNFQKETT